MRWPALLYVSTRYWPAQSSLIATSLILPEVTAVTASFRLAILTAPVLARL